MIFKQIPVGMMANFTYVLGCEKTRKAAVVDPPSDISDIIKVATENGLNIEFIIATHSHSDHTEGIRSLVRQTGAKVAVHKEDAPSLERRNIPTDRLVGDGDELMVGDIRIEILHTPGHTPGSICLLADKKLLTGDTLFVGNCGRSDLPGGSARHLYQSLHEKLKKLRDDIEVYPGHDYGDRPASTIAREKATNPTLTCKSYEEFERVP